MSKTSERSRSWPTLESDDAADWADAWMSHFGYAVDGDLEDIRHTMLGWFANAIETGRAFGER